MRHALDDARAPRRDLLSDGSPFNDDFATAVEHVRLEDRRLSLRGHRLGPSLDDVEFPVESVLGPFHVHRSAVVRFYRDRAVGEFEHFGVAKAEARPVRLRRGNVAHRGFSPALDENHLHALVAEQATQDGAMTDRQRGLVDVELVRVNGALDDVLTQPVGAGNEHDVAKTRFGVEREHHAGRRQVRAHHFHDPDRQGDFVVVESLVDAIVD